MNPMDKATVKQLAFENQIIKEENEKLHHLIGENSKLNEELEKMVGVFNRFRRQIEKQYEDNEYMEGQWDEQFIRPYKMSMSILKEDVLMYKAEIRKLKTENRKISKELKSLKNKLSKLIDE